MNAAILQPIPESPDWGSKDARSRPFLLGPGQHRMLFTLMNKGGCKRQMQMTWRCFLERTFSGRRCPFTGQVQATTSGLARCIRSAVYLLRWRGSGTVRFPLAVDHDSALSTIGHSGSRPCQSINCLLTGEPLTCSTFVLHHLAFKVRHSTRTLTRWSSSTTWSMPPIDQMFAWSASKDPWS
jgi:hypothetical protein